MLVENLVDEQALLLVELERHHVVLVGEGQAVLHARYGERDALLVAVLEQHEVLQVGAGQRLLQVLDGDLNRSLVLMLSVTLSRLVRAQ